MYEKRSNTIQLQGKSVKALRLFENALNLHRISYQEDEHAWGNALVYILQKSWVHLSGLRYSCNKTAACSVIGYLMATGNGFEPSGYYNMDKVEDIKEIMKNYGWEIVRDAEFEEFVPTVRRTTNTQYSMVKDGRNRSTRH